MADRKVKGGPLRRQPPVKGGRVQSYSGFTPALRRWVEREAAFHAVYPSFVIATAVRVVSGIEDDLQPDYREVPREGKGKGRRRKGSR